MADKVIKTTEYKYQVIQSAQRGAQGVRGIPGDLTLDQLQNYTNTLYLADIITKGPRVDPRAFEAAGDGVTNDTAAFTLLETGINNKIIDLMQKKYVVNAEPVENLYVNGIFQVGDTLIQTPADGDWIYDANLYANKSDNVKPMPQGCYVKATYNFVDRLNFYELNTLHNRHVGLTSGTLKKDGNFIVVTREAYQHANDANGKIVMYKTTNGSFDLTPVSTSTIVDTASVDNRDFAFGAMGNGRIGVLSARCFASQVPTFSYSDDNGAVWTTVNVTGATANFVSWFGIHKYPASAGGHDVNGWIVYGAIEGASNGIRYLKTTDNGLTWVEGAAVSDSVNLISEPTVCRVGNDDKWIMVYRQNLDAGMPMKICTSTNMTTWTTPVEGAIMGKNPPYLFYHEGYVYLFIAMRSSTAVDASLSNCLMYARTPAYKVYNNDFSDFELLANYTVIKTLENLLGYFTLTENNGHYYGSIAYKQQDNTNFQTSSVIQVSRLCLITTDTPLVDVTDNWVGTLTDTASVNWRYFYYKGSAVLEQSASILIPYGANNILQKTITFPISYDAGLFPIISITLNALSATTATTLQLGQLRVDTISSTSCRVSIFNNSANFVSGDYATITIQAKEQRTALIG